MMIETTILGLRIGLYRVDERTEAVRNFFDGKFSLGNTTQNLSHAGGLLALCQHSKAVVGIDLEIFPAPVDYMSVAKEFFWPDEIAFLEMSDQNKQADCFLALWTAKEAHCKLFRSNIYDDLPGPNLIAWLKNGCPTYYQYRNHNKEITLLFKEGHMNDKRFLMSISF